MAATPVGVNQNPTVHDSGKEDVSCSAKGRGLTYEEVTILQKESSDGSSSSTNDTRVSAYELVKVVVGNKDTTSLQFFPLEDKFQSRIHIPVSLDKVEHKKWQQKKVQSEEVNKVKKVGSTQMSMHKPIAMQDMQTQPANEPLVVEPVVQPDHASNKDCGGTTAMRLEGTEASTKDKGKSIRNGSSWLPADGGENWGVRTTPPTTVSLSTSVREQTPSVVVVVKSINVAKPLRGILKTTNRFNALSGSDGNGGGEDKHD
ncbi:hypothetical protein L6452_19299 [Arctium lappa]|uniref:Uncharacterized protein n=1 Tax=Arctium lappa TaxID=4217 RepID=A0ACB9BA16_ARCLA|nr:hypothetical protein L6452_19299 [Arctium lappa]